MVLLPRPVPLDEDVAEPVDLFDKAGDGVGDAKDPTKSDVL